MFTSNEVALSFCRLICSWNSSTFGCCAGNDEAHQPGHIFQHANVCVSRVQISGQFQHQERSCGTDIVKNTVRHPDNALDAWGLLVQCSCDEP